jgi:hypothetical protein
VCRWIARCPRLAGATDAGLLGGHQQFSPNVISMMQREDWTFTRVARRKRIDRAAQDAILATVFSAIAWTGYQLVRRLAAIVRISPCGSGWWVVGYRYRAAKGLAAGKRQGPGRGVGNGNDEAV